MEGNPGAKAYFIPCVVYGKTQARMRDPFLESYKNCNGDVRLHPFLHQLLSNEISVLVLCIALLRWSALGVSRDLSPSDATRPII